MDTTIKNEAPKHWAASLREHDQVIATIRHEKNGDLNLVNVLCRVTDNVPEIEKVSVFYQREEYEVRYSDLINISKLVNNGEIIEFLDENIERCNNTENHYKMVARKRSSYINWAMAQAYNNVKEFIKNQK